jgi:hypothetical protein
MLHYILPESVLLSYHSYIDYIYCYHNYYNYLLSCTFAIKLTSFRGELITQFGCNVKLFRILPEERSFSP